MFRASTTMSAGPEFSRHRAPVTFWFVAVGGCLGLLSLLVPAFNQVLELLAFQPQALLARPWTLVTYPFAVSAGSPFGLLLTLYVLWWSGSDNEQWWGPRVQAGFLVAISAATALALTGAWLAGGAPAGAAGVAIPLCACLTVWCLRNQGATILLLIVPVSAKLLLVIEVLSLYAMYVHAGLLNALLAVLACPGLAALYFYRGHALHRFFKQLGQRRPPRAPRPDRAKTERDARVREIFERSGLHVVDDDK